MQNGGVLQDHYSADQSPNILTLDTGTIPTHAITNGQLHQNLVMCMRGRRVGSTLMMRRMQMQLGGLTWPVVVGGAEEVGYIQSLAYYFLFKYYMYLTIYNVNDFSHSNFRSL